MFFVLHALAFGMACAASFDCASAVSLPEKRVCANAELSALDEDLARTYKEVLRLSPAQDDTKVQQRDWIRNFRNACKDDACLLRAYLSRNGELKRVRSKLPFNPNLARPVLIIPAEATGKSVTEKLSGATRRKVELIGRLEFGHDAAGGRTDFVNGKEYYPIRYGWQISDQANEQISKWEESNEYVLVRGILVTLADGTRRFDDQAALEIFAQSTISR